MTHVKCTSHPRLGVIRHIYEGPEIFLYRYFNEYYSERLEFCHATYPGKSDLRTVTGIYVIIEVNEVF